MRSESSGNCRLARAETSWISTAIVVAALLAACTEASPQPAAITATPKPRPPSPTPKADPLEPLSAACKGSVDEAQRRGLIRPGSIDHTGAVILTDARWTTRLDAGLQEGLALCVSHYIAGGQNRWLKRVQFRNQATGVVYATVEGDRFRIGE
jgi:hypothetical protein